MSLFVFLFEILTLTHTPHWAWAISIPCGPWPASTGALCNTYNNNYPTGPDVTGTCQAIASGRDPTVSWCRADNTTDCRALCFSEFDFTGLVSPVPSCAAGAGTCNCGFPPYDSAVCVVAPPPPLCSDYDGTTVPIGSGYGTCPTDPPSVMPAPIAGSLKTGCTARGDEQQAAIDFIASDASINSILDGGGCVDYFSIRPNSGALPGCVCRALPESPVFLGGPSFTGQSGFTWGVCGLSSSTLLRYSSCVDSPPPPPPPGCPYSVGSGIDCTAVTCPTGTKWYFANGSIPFPGGVSGGTCNQNSSVAGQYFSVSYQCYGSAPSTIGYSSCSDAPGITRYYQNGYAPGCSAGTQLCGGSPSVVFVPNTGSLPSVPINSNSDFTVGVRMSSGTAGSCVYSVGGAPFSIVGGGACSSLTTSNCNITLRANSATAGTYNTTITANCTGPVAAGTSGTYTVTIGGSACNFDTGGRGRTCTTNSDCCLNHSCVVAGAQPFLLDPSVTATRIGVNVRTGLTYTPTATTEPIITGNPLPTGGVASTANSGPIRMCVDNTTITNAGGNTGPNYYLFPRAVPGTPNTKVIRWSTTKNAFECLLEADDPRRLRSGANNTGAINGCAIANKSIEVLATAAQYNAWKGTAAATAPSGFVRTFSRPTINWFARLWQWFTAPQLNSVADQQIDRGVTEDAVSVAWQPFGSSSKNLGVTGAPQNINFNDASFVTGTHVAAAARVCEAPATQCYDARVPGCNPFTCTCPSGQQFDETAWQCQTADPEGAIWNPVSSTWECPVGYYIFGSSPGRCRPNKPAIVRAAGAPYDAAAEFPIDEYLFDAAGYPVCGAGRLPSTYSVRIPDFASNGTPKSQATVSGSLYSQPALYAFASPSPPPADPSPSPFYAYWDYPHCACASGHAVAATPLNPFPHSQLPVSSGSVTRFLPDTLDVIQSRGSGNRPDLQYGQVAIARDNGTLDGRLSTVFGVAGNSGSACGCPNVNEEAVRLNAADAQSGYRCRSRIIGDPERQMVTQFSNASHYRTSGYNYVIDDSQETRNAGGDIIERVRLPVSASSPNSLQVYRRGIWMCGPGYSYDSSQTTEQCVFNESHNACDATSEMHPSTTGGSYSQRFDNTVNKKAACCGIQFGRVGTNFTTPIKMDCVDNSKTNYANFDALWSSADPAPAGGQPNLMILTDAAGRELTGWYTLDGVRCNQYASLSRDTITRGRLNPIVQAGQQGQVSTAGDRFEPVGGTISAPAGAASILTGFETNPSKFGATTHPGAGITSNRTDINRARAAIQCPIYVRAAAVYGCDENAKGNTQLRTIDNGGTPRCAAASQIKIHVRVEQIYEIYGQQSIKAQDTIVDSDQSKNVSLEDLWNVHGFGTCPKPSVRNGSTCVY